MLEPLAPANGSPPYETTASNEYTFFLAAACLGLPQRSFSMSPLPGTAPRWEFIGTYMELRQVPGLGLVFQSDLKYSWCWLDVLLVEIMLLFSPFLTSWQTAKVVHYCHQVVRSFGLLNQWILPIQHWNGDATVERRWSPLHLQPQRPVWSFRNLSHKSAP